MEQFIKKMESTRMENYMKIIQKQTHHDNYQEDNIMNYGRKQHRNKIPIDFEVQLKVLQIEKATLIKQPVVDNMIQIVFQLNLRTGLIPKLEKYSCLIKFQ